METPKLNPVINKIVVKVKKSFDEETGLHTWSPENIKWGPVVSAKA